MKHTIAFIHASPASLPPLMQYYKEAAPDLDIVNLLDDGLLRLFSAGNFSLAGTRLAAMLATARDVYAAELAMLTCSAVPRPMLDSLRAGARIPVLKIDYPMARHAVQTGSRIGVAVTFPPTAELTSKLLLEAAGEQGRSVELTLEVAPKAYDALLAGDAATHDKILLDAVAALARQNVDVIVLAQVSMARILERARASVSVPVLTSLDTSLAAVRGLMSGPPAH